MHQGIVLVVTMLAVLTAFPTVRGTAHLTFDNTTEANVTREGCDMSVLCLELPDDCDPEGNTTCLFASLNATTPMAPDGFNLSVGLSGNSTGLIAFGLTQNFSQEVTQMFVCGMNSSGIFFFQTLNRNPNGTLTPNERRTTQIRNKVNGTSIQCEFIIPNVNTSMKGENLDGTTAVVILANGMVNATSGLTESFDVRLNSGQVNLTNAQGTVILPKNLTINRVGCGNEKLCIESPVDCDPQSTDECLFTSLDTTTPANGTFNISVELAGESTGYIAMGFTQNESEGVTNLYICGINSNAGNSFTFRTLDRNNTNGSLTEVDREVADICGVVNGESIQCTFTIVNMSATAMTRETGTVNSILLGNGSINGGVIGTFNVVRNSGPLDITDPAANINNPMVLNITREGCGLTNLCVAYPENCDPLTDNMCQFMSSNVTVSTTTNAFNMTVRLSGYSMGYFALGLAMNASEGTSTIFACGNDTGGVFLRTFTRNNLNGDLTSINRSVTVPAINVSGRSIECEFTILDLNNVETRETDGVVAVVILGNGTLNATVLDALNRSMLNPLNIIRTVRVNLTSPTGTVTSAQNGARAGRSSDAMLILMSLVTLLAALQG